MTGDPHAEKIREAVEELFYLGGRESLRKEGLAALDALVARQKQLEEALEQIVQWDNAHATGGCGMGEYLDETARIARAALDRDKP